MLQFITHPSSRMTIEEEIRQAVAGGCRWVHLRMKDATTETGSKVQEQAGDILEDAKAINEARAAKAEAEVIEDAAEAETTETNE